MFETVDLRDWNEYVRLLVGLLALINPLTVLPIFLGLVQSRAELEKRHISSVASVTVLVTLLIFTYFGGALLDLFAITIDSFRIAGGILLLLTALEMMRAKAGAQTQGEDTEVNITSIGIVPLGIPLLAGPGAIVTTIVDATALPGIAHKLAVSVVVVLVAITVYVVLRLSAKAGTYMSPTAMTIFNRVMGPHHRLDRHRVHVGRPSRAVPDPDPGRAVRAGRCGRPRRHVTHAAPARVVELVDTRDLKSLGPKGPCRFESGRGHQPIRCRDEVCHRRG